MGALGPVFRTYEPTRDRLVAVKVFRLDITPEQAESLAEELAKAADAGLFHPSIVEPIAAAVEGTVAYRAEEYVAAESLDVALRHYAPAPLDKVLPFITQLAGAIDFARASGVGHGALHPRDIFITPEEARATGFGVVEALERVGQRAPVRRPYSAPERVEGKPWDTSADVFSLGVIAFELLTGRRPAGTGVSIGPLTGAVAGSDADGVHAVLVRAMDEDPAHRFQSALAFASALEAAGRGQAPNSADLIPIVAAAPAVAETDVRLQADTDLDDLTYEPEPLPVPDDVIEDAVDEMPPPAGIDEREEPAEAELEEHLFRAEEPPVEEPGLEAATSPSVEETQNEEDEEEDDDDLLDEDDDDEFDGLEADERGADAIAFSDDLARAGIGAAGARDLFGDDEPELAQDLEPDITPGEPEIDVEDPPAQRYASIAEPPADRVPEREFGAALAEPPRSPILPYALVGILFLLIGFGGGVAYMKNTAPDQATAPPAAAPPAAGDSGKAYSEQAVTPTPSTATQPPPAEPPSVPGDAPTPGGAAPPPTEPAAPAATTGRLVITSQPTRASVTIDGQWRGRTPLTLDDLKFGSYVVRVVQPGYAVAREEITLTPQQASRTFAATLRRSGQSTAATPRPPAPVARTGDLYVDSRPRGATVFLDGKSVGVTPLRLRGIETGPHAVRLELADHSTWRTSTNVTGGREARVTGSLERIR